jgi:hypothetical protein
MNQDEKTKRQQMLSSKQPMKLQTVANLDYRTAGNQRAASFSGYGGSSAHLLVPGGCTCCMGCTCCSCSW